MTEYNDDDRIVIFKNKDPEHEKAPHWTGRLVLSEEVLEELAGSEDRQLRVAVWKTYPKEGDGFFLSGQVSIPLSKGEDAPKRKKKEDDWDDDDF